MFLNCLVTTLQSTFYHRFYHWYLAKNEVFYEFVRPPTRGRLAPVSVPSLEPASLVVRKSEREAAVVVGTMEVLPKAWYLEISWWIHENFHEHFHENFHGNFHGNYIYIYVYVFIYIYIWPRSAARYPPLPPDGMVPQAGYPPGYPRRPVPYLCIQIINIYIIYNI